MASIKHIDPINDEEAKLIALIQKFDGSIQEWFDNELDELHEEADEDRRDLLGDFIKMAAREGLQVNVISHEELINI